MGLYECVPQNQSLSEMKVGTFHAMTRISDGLDVFKAGEGSMMDFSSKRKKSGLRRILQILHSAKVSSQAFAIDLESDRALDRH